VHAQLVYLAIPNGMGFVVLAEFTGGLAVLVSETGPALLSLFVYHAKTPFHKLYKSTGCFYVQDRAG
jgi:hypothetical protein